MNTRVNIQKNAQRIVATMILFIVLGITANAQTRSYTLSVLQKTDYVINEAYDITDYFYFNDGEFIAKAVYFQDYAYHLYDIRRYSLAVQYSLKARGYAINAIEICEDYWHYYDYHYYGYSPTWGHNVNYNVVIGNTQLHWGLTNAMFHNDIRVNWNLYFTTREWNYYRGLPTDVVLLNGLYNYRGGVVYFNDRYTNVHVYRNMQVRMNAGRDVFVKSYPNAVRNMAPPPKDIRPSNAPVPTRTRRETVNAELQFNDDAGGNTNRNNSNGGTNTRQNPSSSGSPTNDARRPSSSSNVNDATTPNTGTGNNSSAGDRRRPTTPNANTDSNSSTNDARRTPPTAPNANTGSSSSTSDARRTTPMPNTGSNSSTSDARRTTTTPSTGSNSSTSDTRRTSTTSTDNTTTRTTTNNQSVQDNSRRSSQTTSPQVNVNNQSNAAQDRQARQQTQQSTTTRSQPTSSPSSSSSSTTSSRRR